MPVKDNEVVALTGWPAGVDNVTREDQVPLDALRQAVNTNLTPDGKPERRTGYTERVAGAHHAIFCPGPFLFAVVDGDLVRYDEAFNPTALVTGVRLSMAYECIDGVTYFSDGETTGRVTRAGAVEPIAVPCPGQPTLAAAASGGLAAGTYQVAITYLAADGRESGSSLATLVTVPDGGGIAVSAIPPNAQAATVRFYVSGANDDTLRWAFDIASGTTTATITHGPRGRVLDSQFLEPVPAATLLRYLNGRLYAAVGNVLLWSPPFRYGMWHPDNYAAFDNDITMMEPAAIGPDAGYFLATRSTETKEGRTYFVRGSDPKNWSLGIAHMHGVVPGSATQVPGTVLGLPDASSVPYWLSTNGLFCYGTADGRVVPLTQGRFVTPQDGTSAATVLREVNGMAQLITSLLGGMTNDMHASDSIVATVRRHGVTT